VRWRRGPPDLEAVQLRPGFDSVSAPQREARHRAPPDPEAAPASQREVAGRAIVFIPSLVDDRHDIRYDYVRRLRHARRRRDPPDLEAVRLRPGFDAVSAPLRESQRRGPAFRPWPDIEAVPGQRVPGQRAPDTA